MKPTPDWKTAAKKLNDGLRNELRAYPRDKVDAFIRFVGPSIGTYEITKQNSETVRVAELKRLRASVTAFLEVALKPVVAEPYPQDIRESMLTVRVILRPYGAPDSAARIEYKSEGGRFYQARDAAAVAVKDYLREIDAAIGAAKPRAKSRPSASDHGLLATVAQRYTDTFGERPTSTPGGTFSNIAALILENVRGKMPSDVTRPVRAAIKAIGQK